MDELIKLVVQKTGISEAQARTAVATVVDFIKGKLPAPIASQVDAALAGGSVSKGLEGLGGLFGK